MIDKIKGYRNSLSRFVASDIGQCFFNIAYSVGAAIAILGVLFKILHFPYGNLLLTIGLGTEVVMFLLVAFDLPPRSYNWENVFPELGNGEKVPVEPESDETVSGKSRRLPDPVSTEEKANGGSQGFPLVGQLQPNDAATRLNEVCESMLKPFETMTLSSETLTRAAEDYVERMHSLSENIGAINALYEIQLKSVSSQLESIERISRGIKDVRDMYEKSSAQSARYCEETEKMTRYMEQLNTVYRNMLTAMTVNMPFNVNITETKPVSDKN